MLLITLKFLIMMIQTAKHQGKNCFAAWIIIIKFFMINSRSWIQSFDFVKCKQNTSFGVKTLYIELYTLATFCFLSPVHACKFCKIMLSHILANVLELHNNYVRTYISNLLNWPFLQIFHENYYKIVSNQQLAICLHLFKPSALVASQHAPDI